MIVQADGPLVQRTHAGGPRHLDQQDLGQQGECLQCTWMDMVDSASACSQLTSDHAICRTASIGPAPTVASSVCTLVPAWTYQQHRCPAAAHRPVVHHGKGHGQQGTHAEHDEAGQRALQQRWGGSNVWGLCGLETSIACRPLYSGLCTGMVCSSSRSMPACGGNQYASALTQADHLRSRIAVLIESGVRTPYIRIAARE